ncbi:MAG: FumA C-terminus/TtdB family hydratase beta subunit [Actinomycetota bacterium]|nr:FumA C-terminus/TtdB family hydratase beta subunit [Actinomycetota bacterium]MDD5666769.1 FumA C-terminus/TtdB family hydratase beta subunit [Actinomycetota bacterium]
MGSRIHPPDGGGADVTEVRLPLTREVRESLRAGDRLLLTGRVLTARDQAHRRMIEALERGEALPVNLRGEVVYYAGPSPAPAGKPAGSIGPTTSSRMDPYTPRLVEEGVAAFIGKGPRSPEVRGALLEKGAVYLVGVGGAAALLGSRVRAMRAVAYDDLGPEAVYELEVDGFPVVVAYDLAGGDVFSHLG